MCNYAILQLYMVQDYYLQVLDDINHAVLVVLVSLPCVRVLQGNDENDLVFRGQKLRPLVGFNPDLMFLAWFGHPLGRRGPSIPPPLRHGRANTISHNREIRFLTKEKYDFSQQRNTISQLGKSEFLEINSGHKSLGAADCFLLHPHSWYFNRLYAGAKKWLDYMVISWWS